MSGPSQPPLRFTGHRGLAHRLVLSTLTGRPIRVSQIRPTSHTNPGLANHEVSLLRLLESITNGSAIEFSMTGTILVYRPGLITGSNNKPTGSYSASPGGVTTHELPPDCSRGVSYFLIPLCLLAPFSKAPFNIMFTGPGVITSATPTGDVSADTVRTSILPLYAYFGIQLNLELRILRRSSAGSGGKGGAGEVQLVFGHQVRLPKTLHLLQPGRVKRIRGVAYSIGVAGSNNARMIETARGVLNHLCADTYVFSDVTSAPSIPTAQGQKRRIGVGFGLSLVAETTTRCLYSADIASAPSGGQAAEDLGQQCACQLLESVSRGGCVSTLGAPTVLTFMAMGSEDVGRISLGKDVLGTEETIALARDLQTFGFSGWGIRDAPGSEDEVVVSIVGKGVGNVGRKIA